MQADSSKYQPIENSESLLDITSGLLDGDSSASEDLRCYTPELTYFHGCYNSYMEMFASADTVAAYLDVHREWFLHCAHPMTAEPLGENGYELTIGQFGAFGYQVEPKIGLDLLPQDQGIYRIQTIPIPGYEAPGYEVNFQAAMYLLEMDIDPTLYYLPAGVNATLSPKMTRVEWDLKLEVAIQFPRFIQTLPKSLIQTTGDRLLNQIVRQVSRCLTHKVQEDFHSTRNIPFARKRKKYPWNLSALN